MAQYHNVDRKVLLLSMTPWYRVETLLSELTAIRSINFSITEQRQQALERINKMLNVSVFSVDRRFIDGTYVCEFYGDFARKFQQLKLSLSFKDVAFKTQATEVVNSNFNDSHVAFWSATTNLIDQILRFDGVFNRAEFENKFMLDWH